MRNIASVGINNLVRDGLRQLQRRLPPGWSVGEAQFAPAVGRVDAMAQIAAPDQRIGSIALEAKSRLDPKGARAVVEASRDTREILVVVARYLSAAARERLQEGEVGYIDLTGNVRIAVPDPGLFIETQGASQDPDRDERPLRSLRGPKAGRIVRALIDRKRPPGVRELAAITKIDPGYTSRVLALLDSEALVTRVGRGLIQTVDWPALLKRWALQAPLESRGQVATYLEARGLPALVARLRDSSERYVVSGGLAAAAFAPLAPARLAIVWLRDAAEAATKLGFRPAEAGANVLLVEPGDEWVFEGAAQREGVWYAAPSQIAADLLTSPGRGPAEGEELVAWMRANEGAWRP